MQGGFDIIALLNRVAVMDIALSFLVLLRGHAEKASLESGALNGLEGFLARFYLFRVRSRIPSNF